MAWRQNRAVAVQGGKVQLLHQAVGLFPDGEAGGDFCPDQLIQLLGLEVLFPQAHRFHTAADVHPHQVGGNLIGDGHGGAHRAALAGVDIRHHPDPAALGKLLAAQQDHLGDRGLIHHIGKDLSAVIFSADFQQKQHLPCVFSLPV